MSCKKMTQMCQLDELIEGVSEHKDSCVKGQWDKEIYINAQVQRIHGVRERSALNVNV